MFLETQAR